MHHYLLASAVAVGLGLFSTNLTAASVNQNLGKSNSLSESAYKADWESLKQVPVPRWYDDAKFGIFIHWGPYAVPGTNVAGHYAEHYAHDMYESKLDYQEKNWGPLTEFGYKDLPQ